MNKGLILEVNGEEAIVLTPEGEFRSVKKIKHQDLHVGDEIIVPNVQVLSSSRKRRRNFISSIALAASFLLVFVSVFTLVPIGNDDEAIAFVNLDINPSIEIGLNKSLHVIEITGLNAKGRTLAENVDELVGKSLDETTYQIIVTAKDLGYFENNRDILLSTSFVDEQTELEYNQILKDALHQVEQKVIVVKEDPDTNAQQSGQDSKNVLEDGSNLKDVDPEQTISGPSKSIFIHQVKVTKEIRAEAKEHGISPGKYMIYLAAKEQGIDIELNDVKEDSISDLVHEIKGIPVVIGSKNEKELPQDRQENEQKDQLKQQSEQNAQQAREEKDKDELNRPTPPGLTKKADKDQEKKEESHDQDKQRREGKKDDDDEDDRDQDEDEQDNYDPERENNITITIPGENTIEFDLDNILPARESDEKKKRKNEKNNNGKNRSDKEQKVDLNKKNNRNQGNDNDDRDNVDK